MEYYRKILLLFSLYTIFTIQSAIATDDEDEEEEDVVGEILEEEGIDRNPPEVSSPPPEAAGRSQVLVNHQPQVKFQVLMKDQ